MLSFYTKVLYCYMQIRRLVNNSRHDYLNYSRNDNICRLSTDSYEVDSARCSMFLIVSVEVKVLRLLEFSENVNKRLVTFLLLLDTFPPVVEFGGRLASTSTSSKVPDGGVKCHRGRVSTLN